MRMKMSGEIISSAVPEQILANWNDTDHERRLKWKIRMYFFGVV